MNEKEFIVMVEKMAKRLSTITSKVKHVYVYTDTEVLYVNDRFMERYSN